MCTVWHCFSISQSVFKMLLEESVTTGDQLCSHRPLSHKDYVLEAARKQEICENSTGYLFP